MLCIKYSCCLFCGTPVCGTILYPHPAEAGHGHQTWFGVCKFEEEYFKIYLFLLCWVFVSARGLSLVAASGGHSSSRCAGLSLSRPLSYCGAQAPDAQAQQLWLTGLVAPRHVGSSQTRARTRVPLHQQADSQPLRHQGSPEEEYF